jgi:hypothetical protein
MVGHHVAVALAGDAEDHLGAHLLLGALIVGDAGARVFVGDAPGTAAAEARGVRGRGAGGGVRGGEASDRSDLGAVFSNQRAARLDHRLQTCRRPNG